MADRTFASVKLLSPCRSSSKPVTFITRIRVDAALHEPAPPRRPGQRGRPRLKGERQPNLSVVAEDPSTVWKPATIADWYGSGEREVEIASATSMRYSTGLPAVPVRSVSVGDLKGEFRTQANLCTDLEADPEEILRWFVMRRQFGSNFPKGAQAPEIRDPEAVLGHGETASYTSSVGIVLVGHFVCASADEARSGHLSASGGLVLQSSSDLRRCARVGVKGAADPGGADFCVSPSATDTAEVPRAFVERLTDAVCYAA